MRPGFARSSKICGNKIHLDIEKEEVDTLRMLVEYLPAGVLLSYLPDDYLDRNDV